jgi:hypothetical protein
MNRYGLKSIEDSLLPTQRTRGEREPWSDLFEDATPTVALNSNLEQIWLEFKAKIAGRECHLPSIGMGGLERIDKGNTLSLSLSLRLS